MGCKVEKSICLSQPLFPHGSGQTTENIQIGIIQIPIHTLKELKEQQALLIYAKINIPLLLTLENPYSMPVTQAALPPFPQEGQNSRNNTI